MVGHRRDRLRVPDHAAGHGGRAAQRQPGDPLLEGRRALRGPRAPATGREHQYADIAGRSDSGPALKLTSGTLTQGGNHHARTASARSRGADAQASHRHCRIEVLSPRLPDVAQPSPSLLPRLMRNLVRPRAREADADRPADGSGRMRRGRPGDGPRPSRRLDSARAAARGVRRLARRQQGEQHRAGRRARSASTPRASARSPTTLHELPMPCIIHWNFNHFVVLEGIDGDRASINDPAMGRRSVDMAELDLAFTGVVLAMEPTESFRKIGSKPQGLRLLLRELRASRGRGRPGDRRQPRAHRSRHHHPGLFQGLRRRGADPEQPAAGSSRC